MAGNSEPLPYGHAAEAAIDIEGLSVRTPIHIEFLLKHA